MNPIQKPEYPDNGSNYAPNTNDSPLSTQYQTYRNQYNGHHTQSIDDISQFVNIGGAMRKIFLSILFVLFTVSSVLAAGSSTVITARDLGTKDNKVEKKELSILWTSDSATGAVSATIGAATYNLHGWILYSVETDPGATAPDADYDIAITDAAGLDICATNTINRHTSTTQMVSCQSSTQPYYIVRGDLTFAITNAGNSKVGTAILIFLKD